jgi:hypothetical protein
MTKIVCGEMRCVLSHNSGGRLVIGPYPSPSWIIGNSISLCVNLCNEDEKSRYNKYEDVVLTETKESPPTFLYVPMDMSLNNVDVDILSKMMIDVRDRIVTGKICYVHDGSCSDRALIVASCIISLCDEYSASHNILIKVDSSLKHRQSKRLISSFIRIRQETMLSKY